MYQRLYVPPPRRPYATRRIHRRTGRRRVILIVLCLGLGLAGWKLGGVIRTASGATAVTVLDARAQAETRDALRSQRKQDHVRRKRIGTASFYAASFFGRTMADGTPMKPHGNNAASRTLPLGTTALVTNLENGRTAIVTIRDRGPYVDGRIVDLSPATAQKIGITRQQGLAKVEVAPLEVPMPDGSIKPGLSDREAELQDRRLAQLDASLARLARLEPSGPRALSP